MEQTKRALYSLLNKQLAALCAEENHPLPNLANASAILAGALQSINWAGFYIIQKNAAGADELMLGPFQGKAACIRIPCGKGVCGTAFAENRTQVIADVHTFAGHIACDSASNSEIVIPLHDGSGNVAGVLDIDSPLYSRFDEEDRAGLEQFAHILEQAYSWELIV